MTWITWPALAPAVLVVALFGLAAFGAARWTAATEALLRKLEMARVPATTVRYTARELEGLPAPVQRYFRATIFCDCERGSVAGERWARRLLELPRMFEHL